VTVGSGSYNGVALGSGTDVVTVEGGSYDEINGGNGNETIYLGAGTYNTYNGAAHHTNVCHLPTPPSSWHGTVAAYYHDTITNCTVVTP
jgi:Ca2+-binding RTX toxin-like protein